MQLATLFKGCFGSLSRFYSQVAVNVPRYLNATCIPQHGCEPASPNKCLPPAPIQVCCVDCTPPQNDTCNTPCGSGYSPAGCFGGGQFPAYPAPYTDYNCFGPANVNVNRASHYQYGFKNVQAYKSWHGSKGFVDDCPADSIPSCTFTPVQAAPQVHYLTATAYWQKSAVGGVPDSGITIATVTTLNSVVSVGRYTGAATVSVCNTSTNIVTTSTNEPAWGDPCHAACPPFDIDGNPQALVNGCCQDVGLENPCSCTWTKTGTVCSPCGPGAACPSPPNPPGTAQDDVGTFVQTCPRLFDGTTFAVPACPQPFSGHITGNGSDGNPPDPTGNNQPGILTIEVSAANYSLVFVPDATPLGTFLTYTIALSDPYTADDVQADCDTLLGVWDMTNDEQYPWRVDGAISSAPLVTFDEGYNSPQGQGGAADPLSFLNNLCGTYGGGTGQIVGRPTLAGYDPFWDYTYVEWVYGPQEDNPDCSIWLPGSYGAYAPSWCPQATQWTDNYSSQWLYGGAYTGQCGGNGFPFLSVPGSCENPSAVFSYGVFKQKWVETLLYVKPGHNFARPCGAADRALIDQTSINCLTNPGGSLLYPHAPCDCDNATNNPGPAAPAPCPPPTGVTPNPWNTSAIKGNFALRTLSWDTRGVGEYARLYALYNAFVSKGCPNLPEVPANPRNGNPLSNIQCSQYQIAPNGCHFTVVGYTPNGETWPGGLIQGMPHIPLDEDYGAFQYYEVDQWMRDPLQQNQFSPDCAGTVWDQDDGSCQACQTSEAGLTTCYYWPNYEECLIEVPAGAPALPAGIILGAQPNGAGGWVGPLSGEPVQGGEGTPTPWLFWTHQLANNCNLG